MKRRRDRLTGTCAVVVLATMAGACAAPLRQESKSPPSRATPAVEEPAPSTPESSPAPPPAPAAAPVVPGAAADGATGTVVPPYTFAEAQVAFDEASSAFAAAGSDCASLCKALASMTNATARLCALAENDTPDRQKRCSEARAKLDEAQAKVKSTCGAC